MFIVTVESSYKVAGLCDSVLENTTSSRLFSTVIMMYLGSIIIC